VTELERNALVVRAGVAPWRVHGHSRKGRPLTHRQWPGRGAPPVLMFGAIHGDEPLGAACLMALADELDAEPPAPRAVWLLPVANPDGFLAGKKNNAADVDLNRNWPAANWQATSEPGYSPGPQAASEPETLALAQLIAQSGARRLIALHSPLRTVNYDGPAGPLAERMAAANGYGASADIGYPTPGSFGSRYGLDLGLEVVTLEIPLLDPADAWRENRAALRHAVDL
jgi:protein MpaA